MLHGIFACLFAVRPLFSLASHAGMAEVIPIEKFTWVEFTIEIASSAGRTKLKNRDWVVRYLMSKSLVANTMSGDGEKVIVEEETKKLLKIDPMVNRG